MPNESPLIIDVIVLVTSGEIQKRELIAWKISRSGKSHINSSFGCN